MSFRIKAFLIHLAVSISISALGLLLVFTIWHPNPLQKAVDVTHIFLIMLAVDAILGPLLTLAIANANKSKKMLKIDFSIIAIVQLTAYLYGMYSIAQSRPVWIAYDAGVFELVQANSVHNTDKAKPEFQYNSWLSPKWVAIRPYTNAQEQFQRMQNELANGISPSMQANLYEPISQIWTYNLEKKAKHLSELEQFNTPQNVHTVLMKYPQANAWLPLKAPATDMVVLINTSKKQILNIVDLRPWKNS